jgi:hypothetical protein
MSFLLISTLFCCAKSLKSTDYLNMVDLNPVVSAIPAWNVDLMLAVTLSESFNVYASLIFSRTEEQFDRFLFLVDLVGCYNFISA